MKQVIEQKYIIPMICKRCKHNWNYKGKNTYVANCPYCKTTVSIRTCGLNKERKMMLLDADSKVVEAPESATIVTTSAQPTGFVEKPNDC